MSMVVGMFIGLIGGYILLFNELLKKGRESGYRCDRCQANFCFAKRCWYNYNNLHKKTDIKNKK